MNDLQAELGNQAIATGGSCDGCWVGLGGVWGRRWEIRQLRLGQLRRQLLLGTLSLLLLVADAAGLGLEVADLAEVESDGPGAEGVGLGLAAVLLEGGAEATDEGVEAAPGLLERARAGGGRVRVPVEGTYRGVDFGLPELVEVPEELEHVGPAAPGERQRRAVILQVLPERVPVAPLLVLVPTRGGRSGPRGVPGTRTVVVWGCGGGVDAGVSRSWNSPLLR
ncbi:LIGHT-DEPENDENT SHORT HYPOCOTYLS-like protein [Actinidia rufa]|uniref:LIGHT-DEPENDENT SHORT HYPOCOTYLS-like protein n=1 Tax=Actinidia rufa TaxID=165716 RepID=A0A7J0GRR8_9ERIC|nr:LIGHT-DEPENDENT SHORT HYPOCOTYLS-like protein [Actinidia rufa]